MVAARDRGLSAPLPCRAATLSGFSRMYDDRHWASDIISGAAIGTFAGIEVVRFNHSHPSNMIDRFFLGSMVEAGSHGTSRPDSHLRTSRGRVGQLADHGTGPFANAAMVSSTFASPNCWVSRPITSRSVAESSARSVTRCQPGVPGEANVSTPYFKSCCRCARRAGRPLPVRPQRQRPRFSFACAPPRYDQTPMTKRRRGASNRHPVVEAKLMRG